MSPDDGGQPAPHGVGSQAHRLHHGDDEPEAAVSVPGILRGHTPAPRHDSEVKIWSALHGDMGMDASEIPCRVSSDLHEWRNDFPTVSTTDPAKLKYE
jgi:hypothetical protein